MLPLLNYFQKNGLNVQNCKLAQLAVCPNSAAGHRNRPKRALWPHANALSSRWEGGRGFSIMWQKIILLSTNIIHPNIIGWPMIYTINSALEPLELKVPLKNLHLVTNLLLHQDHIFVIYQSAIHIHSLTSMVSSLPSLIYTLDLQEVLRLVSKDSYQDPLTKSLSKTQKAGLAKVFFSEQLEEEANVFMKMDTLVGRLLYLGGEHPRLKSSQLSQKGHLLLVFEDGRAIFLKRNNDSKDHTNLYNLTNIGVLNEKISDQIVEASFWQNTLTRDQLPGILVGYRSSKFNELVLSKMQLHERDLSTTEVPISQGGKKQTLSSQGIISLHTAMQPGCQIIIMSYYNKVLILEVQAKGQHRQTAMQVISRKIIPLGTPFLDEYILDTHWDSRNSILHLVSSVSIGKIEIKPNEDPEEQIVAPKARSRSKSSVPDVIASYEVQMVARSGYLSKKASILLIDQESCVEGQGHHKQFCLQTKNGIIVKLVPNSQNYKEGYLTFQHQAAAKHVRKMIENLSWEDQRGGCIDLGDLKLLEHSNRWGSLKKEILDEISKQSKKTKESSRTHNYSKQAVSQKLINVLIINILDRFDSKVQVAQRMVDEAVKELGGKEGACFVSGRRILSEDVMECCRCSLYALKEQCEGRGLLGRCPICWNELRELG